jgi:urease subunit gamma/beta
VLLDDGTRLISLVDPLGDDAQAEEPGPGAIVAPPAGPPGPAHPNRREHLALPVTNTSRRVVRVSSHFPFDQVNARLEFDRRAARGFRLDLDAGSSQRWAPGETVMVTLVRFAGGADAPAEGMEA